MTKKFLQPVVGTRIKTLGPVGELYYFIVGTIVIPSFNITRSETPPVSILVGWMDFELSKKFCIPLFQSITYPTTCCLCVSFRMDDRVFRYKLKEGSEVGLYYPMYNGELLMHKIRIEVWSIDNTCINTGAIHIQTSIRQTTTEKYSSQLYYIEDQVTTTEYFDFGANPDFVPIISNPQVLDNNIWTLASSSEPSSSGIPVI